MGSLGDADRLGMRKWPLGGCDRGDGGSGGPPGFSWVARGMTCAGDLGEVMSTRGVVACVAGGGETGIGRDLGGGVAGRFRGFGGVGGFLLTILSDCVECVLL